jgi:hypothetical protein
MLGAHCGNSVGAKALAKPILGKRPHQLSLTPHQLVVHDLTKLTSEEQKSDTLHTETCPIALQ